MIRLTVPSIEEDDLAAVRDVLASGFLVQGPRVAAFEQTIADLVGTRYAVAVANGTAALHMALLALDIGPNDIVVTAAYSWPATANVIELCGAETAFVDIRPDTFYIDPSALDTVLQRLMSAPATARRVKAVMPVHAFGQLADMPAILEITGPSSAAATRALISISVGSRRSQSWGSYLSTRDSSRALGPHSTTMPGDARSGWRRFTTFRPAKSRPPTIAGNLRR